MFDKYFELPIAKTKFFVEVLVLVQIVADLISNIIYLTKDYADIWTGIKNLLLDPCKSLVFALVIVAILTYIESKMDGKVVKAATSRPVAPAAPAAPARPNDGSWICPNCGTKNFGKFCAKCGSKNA